MKLYNYELSANCYKVRLLMSLIGIEWENITVDYYPGREHKSEWFLKLNPLGQLPLIEDDGFILRDSHAILVFLATKFDDTGKWYPTQNAEVLGEIAQWLGFADSLNSTAGSARLHDGLFIECDIDSCRSGAHRLMRILDEHLWFQEKQNSMWICSHSNPTIADIACFPSIMLSEEGGISRIDYPAIRRWCDRVRRIPNFIVIPGIFAAGPDINCENTGS